MTYPLSNHRPATPTRRRGEDLFDELFRSFFPPRLAESGAGWAPRLDVTESPDAYQVRVELPGVDPAQVKVTLEQDTLTVSGEKQDETVEGDHRRHVSERAWGSFSRRLSFPVPLAADAVEAEASHGVLTIRLPKAQESQARTIEIKSAQ